jgi:hypothetical protein
MIDFKSRRRALCTLGGASALAAAAGFGLRPNSATAGPRGSGGFTLYQVLCASGYTQEFWGANTPPPPTITGTDVSYSSQQQALNVQAGLQQQEYWLQNDWATTNRQIRPYKVWVPQQTYSIVSYTSHAVLSSEDEDIKVYAYNGMEIQVEPLQGVDPQEVTANLLQMETSLLKDTLFAAVIAAATGSPSNVLMTLGAGAAIIAGVGIAGGIYSEVQIYGAQGFFIRMGQSLGGLQ